MQKSKVAQLDHQRFLHPPLLCASVVSFPMDNGDFHPSQLSDTSMEQKGLIMIRLDASYILSHGYTISDIRKNPLSMLVSHRYRVFRKYISEISCIPPTY